MKPRLLAAVLGLGFVTVSEASTIFDIEIVFDGSSTFTASQQAAFTTAADTWESLIIDYKTLSVPIGTKLTITANNPGIDGVGGTLGSAGPTYGNTFGGSYLYATAGSMSFDSADVNALELAGTFGDVILHEMGHVIGIGTLWSSSAVGLPGYQELYVAGSGKYTGEIGLAAFQQEFVGQESATFVPVELGGGPGTADGHWNEGDGGSATGITRVSDGQDMNLMLMSGWLNPGSYISDTTLGSFEDLGYNTTLVLAAVPEPASAILLLAGFLGLTMRRYRS
ncbi:MAG: PEP-CTERM sorting domain-containing protein [Akkermansiaceae bacterium]